ncbi:MAG: hypothetical protein MUE80_07865, partial [Acidobacteria bacterium]|nr:hypothetical protein [Acidobacteriota bacterium]
MYDADLVWGVLDPACDRGVEVALAAKVVEDADIALVEAPLLEDPFLPDGLDQPRGHLGPVDDDGDLLLRRDDDAQVD